jgi:hypothetical protein
LLFPKPVKIGANKEDTSASRLLNNSIFIEILGNGRYPSLNYERILFNKKKFYFSCRIGFSYYYSQRYDYWLLRTHKYDVPFLVNGLFMVKRHFTIETGIGMTQQYYYYNDDHNGIVSRSTYLTTWLTATIGARLQVRHFMIGIAFTPLVNVTEGYMTVFDSWERSGYGIDPMFGLKIGYSFGKY